MTLHPTPMAHTGVCLLVNQRCRHLTKALLRGGAGRRRRPRVGRRSGRRRRSHGTLAIGETVIFADVLSPLLLIHLLEVEKGCSRMTVSSTAKARRGEGGQGKQVGGLPGGKRGGGGRGRGGGGGGGGQLMAPGPPSCVLCLSLPPHRRFQQCSH